MKTINEKIEGMSMRELQVTARAHYCEMRTKLLVEIDNVQRSYPSAECTSYNILKILLEEEDLFNPEYEVLFRKALEGKLDVKDLSKQFVEALQ